jgi:hypothetical protein
MKGFRVGAVQMCATEDVAGNLERCAALTAEAACARGRAGLAPRVLRLHRRKMADKLPLAESLDGGGPIVDAVREMARRSQVWLAAGGLPERAEPEEEGRRVYNTFLLCDPAGETRAVYRKIHLFDVAIPGRAELKESATTAPGGEGGGGRDADGAARALDLLRRPLPGALPRAGGRRRRRGADGAGGLHRPHRGGPLAHPAQGAGDREPVLRGGGGPARAAQPGPRVRSATPSSSIRGAWCWPRSRRATGWRWRALDPGQLATVRQQMPCHAHRVLRNVTRDPDATPRLPRGKWFGNLRAIEIIRIGMVATVLVVVIVLGRPCADGIARFVDSYAPPIDAGRRPRPCTTSG